MDKLAKHSKVRCSAPEVNGAVAQGKFTFLRRETCASGAAVTPGSAIREGRCGSTGVSRGHSTESNEPATKTPDGLTTREGLNLAGSIDPGWTGAGVDAEGLNRIQSQRGRDRALRYPSGRSGTAGRGPAGPVVWEPGGPIPGGLIGPCNVHYTMPKRLRMGSMMRPNASKNFGIRLLRNSCPPTTPVVSHTERLDRSPSIPPPSRVRWPQARPLRPWTAVAVKQGKRWVTGSNTGPGEPTAETVRSSGLSRGRTG